MLEIKCIKERKRCSRARLNLVMIFLQICPWGGESPLRIHGPTFMTRLLCRRSNLSPPTHLTSYGAKLPIYSIQCPMISTSQVFRVKSFQIVARMRIQEEFDSSSLSLSGKHLLTDSQ